MKQHVSASGAHTETPLLPDIVARILSKLGVADKPTLDLAGLNRVYAAYCCNVPNDNIQKRIWLVGDRAQAPTGGDPVAFFENWLAHGTGGTCFPASGGLYALLRAIGFAANRISASIIMDGIEQDRNHGSVLVTLDGVDYLADPQLASFDVLPLVRGQATSSGDGLHGIRAVPVGDELDVLWFPGSNRQTPLVMRPNLKLGPVDHQFFLDHYYLSTLRDRTRSPFNDALFIARRFANSIVVVGRGNKTEVRADNVVTKTPVNDSEVRRILIDELGISEQCASAIPPDDPAGTQR